MSSPKLRADYCDGVSHFGWRVEIGFNNPHEPGTAAERQYAKYIAEMVNQALKEKGLYSDEVE